MSSGSTNPSLGDYLIPTPDERNTLIFIGIFAGVILVLWNFPYLKYILYPFKLVTVALHEFSHAAAGCCTGAKIEGIKIDPEEGGVTHMRGGVACCTLPAGYLGSSFFGALMIFCGFDLTASKVMSVILSFALLLTLFWARNWLTRFITVFFYYHLYLPMVYRLRHWSKILCTVYGGNELFLLLMGYSGGFGGETGE